MKKILEAILAINLAVLSCIVFINIILRYGFQTSILSVDELSRYLFVWLTFIGAIVAFMDNAHVQVTFLVDGQPMVLQVDAQQYTRLLEGTVGTLNWRDDVLVSFTAHGRG